jgi:hypothetical protein
MSPKYLFYAIFVTAVSTLSSWGKMINTANNSSSSSGSSWNSTSTGGGSYGGGAGGGHK